MVIRAVLMRVCRRDGTIVSGLLAALRQRQIVDGGSPGQAGASHGQQEWLENERIDERHANQPSPEWPRSHACAHLFNAHDPATLYWLEIDATRDAWLLVNQHHDEGCRTR